MTRLPRWHRNVLPVWGFVFLSTGIAFLSTGIAAAGELKVVPERVELSGNFARSQLIVSEVEPGGDWTDRSPDRTASAEFVSSNPEVATVSAAGQAVAVGNGEATITVTVGNQTTTAQVVVSEVQPTPVVEFMDHVLPIISKAGCNAGSCHASQHGKGGFTLTVMGFDPDADYRMMVRDRMQRRVSFLQPSESLLLNKPTGRVPHGGGRRLDPNGVDYRILEAWIAAGSPAPKADAPKVSKLTVFPNRRIVAPGDTQQLRVEATFSTGVVRDVTAWSRFDTLDDSVVTVTATGMASVVGRGQTPLMVRFEGQADIVLCMSPFSENRELPGWESRNFVDELAAAKFRELGIQPVDVCDDATFLRRAFLDVTGSLPTRDETVAFLDDASHDKRAKLVDRLLGLTGDPALDVYNDRYAAFWTLKWADLIRNNSDTLGAQGMWAMHNWLQESFRTNKPFNQFVREILTARGSTFSNGPSNYFRVNNSIEDMTESTSQLFLGVRLGCAKCHHHPFEKYSQADYYSFAAFFSRLGTKGTDEFTLSGSETVVLVRSGGETHHPRTGQRMNPTPLEGSPVDDPVDRRSPLADWMTSPENRMFSRNVANRYWSYLMGRGLVDPVDDMRATNPPSNPALLEALADSLVQSGYNVKELMRTIMTSRLYQLSSQPTAENKNDSRFHSYYRVKRLSAEALLDAVDDVCGTRTKFPGLPMGTRATQLPDSTYQDYFLVTFGKPKRVSVCECERSPDENLAQALHTLNGDILAGKIAAGDGRIAKLLAANTPHESIVTELYLVALSRRPTEAEMQASREFLTESPSPAECYQDLLWALVNSKQFLFVN
jgi:hypothetical protein